jgi:hypothetical protein
LNISSLFQLLNASAKARGAVLESAAWLVGTNMAEAIKSGRDARILSDTRIDAKEEA